MDVKQAKAVRAFFGVYLAVVVAAIVALLLISGCAPRDRVIIAAPYYAVPHFTEVYTGPGTFYIRRCC